MRETAMDERVKRVFGLISSLVMKASLYLGECTFISHIYSKSHLYQQRIKITGVFSGPSVAKIISCRTVRSYESHPTTHLEHQTVPEPQP